MFRLCQISLRCYVIIWKLSGTVSKNGSLTKFIVDKDDENVEHKQDGLKFNKFL